MTGPIPTPTRPAPAFRTVAILCLAGLALPEIVLQLSDRGIVGHPLWRPLAYQYGAFWPGLWENWRPNFPAQPWTMFLTYAVLHVGLGHLAGNVLALGLLVGLAPATGGPAGWQLLAVGAGSAIGAAAGFLALYDGPGSMVGASGIVFGFAAAAIVWQAGASGRHRRAILSGAGLMGLNLVSAVLAAGPVAWEAHLGGAVAGAGLAALLPLRRARGVRTPPPPPPPPLR